MTFIASVVAKKGVAIIADSLVTTTRPIIEYDDFASMVNEKIAKSRSRKGNISFKREDISKLFKPKPSHTKNFEEKLFQYDKYTAITIAGSAEMNGERIGNIIHEIISKTQKVKREYEKKTFDDKVAEFKIHIENKIKAHLKSNSSIRPTIFIITHYDHKKEKTVIRKLTVTPMTANYMNQKDNPMFIMDHLVEDHNKVVCDGQNRISERILWGEIDFVIQIVPKILSLISEHLPATKDMFTDEISYKIIQKLMGDSLIHEDIKMTKIPDLSLQQAVDLACLLMRIEVDIQKFTENIPTVGGLIKVATIDKTGFSFKAGHEIEIPINI